MKQGNCDICGEEVIDVDGRVHLLDNDAGYRVCGKDECEEIAFNKLVQEAGDPDYNEVVH